MESARAIRVFSPIGAVYLTLFADERAGWPQCAPPRPLPAPAAIPLFAMAVLLPVGGGHRSGLSP